MISAVLDACVLYPASLRDLFLRLAVEHTYQPKWTEDIHEEWMRNVLKDHPELKPEQLAKTRDLMNTHGGDWEAPDYKSLIPTLRLPDSDDRHVLAAAIAAKAPYIVTFNRKHFPARYLANYTVQVISPDKFVVNLLETQPVAVIEAVRRQRTALKNPPRSLEEHLLKLISCRLPEFAKQLEPFQGGL